MIYYMRHLGDYAKDTRHLTLMEHGAYTLLMDWCYATERALPKDELMLHRMCAAFTKPEQQAVMSVVQQFFQEQPDGYVQKRVEEEVMKAHQTSGKAKAAALKRWTKHSEGNANAMPTHSEGNANAMPTHSEGNANAMPTHSEGSKTRARSHYPVTSNQSSAGIRQPGGGDMTLEGFAETPDESEPDSVPTKKERGRDECFEFLVSLTGASLATVTKGMRGEINTALRDIRAVMPDVTALEMRWRAAAYRQQWPKVTCSPSALAKHWGSLGAAKKEKGGEGDEPVWDWKRMAGDRLEMEIVMPWNVLLERMREMILKAWAEMTTDEQKPYLP
jgi:uncharacterized protein YdaU (DUF1376 family)